jgi:hypothetical protein
MNSERKWFLVGLLVVVAVSTLTYTSKFYFYFVVGALFPYLTLCWPIVLGDKDAYSSTLKRVGYLALNILSILLIVSISCILNKAHDSLWLLSSIITVATPFIYVYLKTLDKLNFK